MTLPEILIRVSQIIGGFCVSMLFALVTGAFIAFGMGSEE
jgi:hypothetical protein